MDVARDQRARALPGEGPPRQNLAEALRLIWRERHLSRAEIARRLGLSRSTVSEIVAELMETGLVEEVGAGESSGGRRPIVLRFDDGASAIVGVDMGATHVGVALTDLRGTVRAWEYGRHPVREDPRGAQALAVSLTERCLGSWRGGARRLLGIGLAVPSPVDPRAPDALSELVLPAWKGIPAGGALRQRFRVPVLVDNDANVAAMAERWWGAGRDVDDFVFVKLATGIGSGIFIEGRLQRGAHGLAGEIGHLSIDPGGEPCVCGLRGCLTTLVGSQALVRRARQLRREHPATTLTGEAFGVAELEDAALAGDPLALQVVREAAEHLGVAVADLVNLLNPSAVVFGGGLARLGDVLLEPLRLVLRSRTLVTSAEVVRLLVSPLGARAVAVGAATLLLDRALADPRHFPAAAARR